jgi:hypothetical protein
MGVIQARVWVKARAMMGQLELEAGLIHYTSTALNFSLGRRKNHERILGDMQHLSAEM